MIWRAEGFNLILIFDIIDIIFDIDMTYQKFIWRAEGLIMRVWLYQYQKHYLAIFVFWKLYSKFTWLKNRRPHFPWAWRVIDMKGSDAKASKCLLMFSFKISIFYQVPIFMFSYFTLIA